jgi:hypothetical protein
MSGPTAKYTKSPGQSQVTTTSKNWNTAHRADAGSSDNNTALHKSRGTTPGGSSDSTAPEFVYGDSMKQGSAHGNTATGRGPYVYVDNPNNLDGRSNYILDIALYKPNGEKLFRRVTLDSGAELNLMSNYVWQDLGIGMETNSSIAIQHLNSGRAGPAQALGCIGIRWHFRGGEKTFNTLFWVLDTEEFDVLIGRTFIEENHIYRRKWQMWPLRIG